MTDVYVRSNEDAAGYKIGEVPLTVAGIDEAVRLVTMWGIDTATEDYADVIASNFRLGDGKAYFEIVVGKADE